MMCKRWLMICICFSFKVSASDTENEGSLWAGLLPWVVIHVIDNSISLEGHIIMYFQIKSQLRGHASLWKLVQSQCQACNSKVLQSRAPERRINRSEAQSTPCVLPSLTLPSGRNMAFFLHLSLQGWCYWACPSTRACWHQCGFSWLCPSFCTTIHWIERDSTDITCDIFRLVGALLVWHKCEESTGSSVPASLYPTLPWKEKAADVVMWLCGVVVLIQQQQVLHPWVTGTPLL